MAVKIGPSTTSPKSLPTVREVSTGKDEWKYYSGTYVVPAGQTVTRFGFEAISSANGDLRAGNFLDDIFLGTEPCGVVTKSVSPINNVQEGDTLTYSVNFKNDGGDEAGSTVLTDNIPDGTEYVPGSLEIISGPNAGKLTDASGDDQGEFLPSENRVVVRLGNGANGSQAGRIPNTDVLPGGTTAQFKVKVLSKYKTTTVANQATVEYDNLLSGNHETRKSNGVTVDVNRPPITPDFEETTWKNTTVTGSVYGVDANGDSLTFTKGTDPQSGTVTVNPDGTWSYEPNPDFVGTDSFTVTVSDGKGGISTSTVTVNVKEPPNRAPVAENDHVTTQQDTSVTGGVYGTDPDGDTLTYAIETNPKHGTVTLNPDGTWTYEPDPGYSGPDIFTVTVSDSKGGVTTSTVTVNVTDKPNQPPVTRDETVTTTNNSKATGSVHGSDPDGDLLTFTKGSDPKHGTVTVNPDGTWTYVPEPGYVGEDSFTVIVDDGKGGKTTSTVTVNVTEPNTPPTPPTNQPPTASGEEVTTEKDTSVTGAVYGTDPDGDPLTYTKGSDPKHGTVTVNPDGTWSYTPEPGYVGHDSFTVIVDDGKGGKTPVTITVNVTEPGTNPDPGTGTDPVNPPIDPDDGDSGGGGGSSNGDEMRSPVVESEKSAKDLNGGSIEVGDTIEYTIRARNTVSSSQITSMVISDKLPEGLEYVTGSLKMDGVSVTDNDDSDRGKYADGTVTGSFGTVTDTDWHTLVLEAKIIKGKQGETIKNVGLVSGDNLNVPNHPKEEITIHTPTPVMESDKEAKDLNGGTIQVGDVIEYTIRARNTAKDSVVKNLKISDALPAELVYVTGSLKVDGQSVTDSDKGSYDNGTVSGKFGDIADTNWHTIVFQAEVKSGQAGQTIRNTGKVTGDNLNDSGQPTEDIIIGGGSGSNPGVPGDTSNGSSIGNPNNPGGDTSSPGSSPTDGASGSGQSNVLGDSDVPGQSGTPSDSSNVESGDSKGTGNKLPNTATNMYSYLLAGCILLLAGLFMLRRKKA
nr:Ig-like domain-containing protein [Paenibacillus ehimensis]